MDRSQEIIRTSWIGIAANVLLAGFKAAVGILASSVAIVMDAVNNLSDALSSVITIVGTKLSQRPADRKHPFGFGRIEYFSAIIIAVIVLSAGITRPHGAGIHHNYTGSYRGGYCSKAHPRPICQEEGRATKERCPDRLGL